MNVTRLQLPNGSLLKIQGADEEQVAAIAAERSAGALPTGNAEEPLEMPTLNFDTEQVQSNAADDDEEAAMAIPTLSFAGR